MPANMKCCTAVALLLAGCGGSGATSTDSSAIFDLGSGCPADTSECVTDQIARVCPHDGSGWLSATCLAPYKCSKGACVNPMPCVPGDAACTSETAAMQCMSDGSGYQAVNCPANTKCVGNGACAGSCIVGESSCLSPLVLANCTDGTNVQTALCSTGQLCVTISTGPIQSAGCMPAECQPIGNGCEAVCGNKKDQTADQTKFFSMCTETPYGYKWNVFNCPAPTSCQSGLNSCGAFNAGSEAGCASECEPGTSRCADAVTVQNCDQNGTWSTTLVTNCNSTPTLAQQACLVSPVDSSQAICGDPICAEGAVGACDSSGKLRPCGADGKLGAAQACSNGTCVVDSTVMPAGGITAGRCLVQCIDGDERCVGPMATTFQVCMMGVWQAPTVCATDACIDYLTANGRPAHVCGVCIPGQHRCDTSQPPQIQTCSPSGQWGASMACTVGACAPVGLSDAGCQPQCAANQPVCVGSAKAGIGTHSGTDAVATCTATGLLPSTSTPCAANAACRVNSSGAAIECVDCVGPTVQGGNENGLVDTRCMTGVETCQAGNAWPTTSAAPCTTGLSCHPEQGTLGTQCQACPSSLGSACTQSLFSPFSSCEGLGYGAPVPCGGMNAGDPPFADCCGNYCVPTTATPAYCGP